MNDIISVLPLIAFVVSVWISILLLRYLIRNYVLQTTGSGSVPTPRTKPPGLSQSELDAIPEMLGHELLLTSDCAICLNKIESKEVVRLLPGCNHGFHLQCIDAWLVLQPVCPLCRDKVGIAVECGNPC
ncbi:hypothetical protein QQ045_004656 [Rhodiola kirilowii]